jgi:D-alanine-D-alanine ligase
LLLHNLGPGWEPAETEAAVDAVAKLKNELRQEGHPVVDVQLADDGLSQVLEAFHPDDHIIFNWCEELPGRPRSDATVAATLEALGFTYTGSPPHVLAFSWDKAATKDLLDSHKIPTPRWQVLDSTDCGTWEYFPAIVKPAFEHCSCGITTEAVVLNRQALTERVAFVQDVFHQPALVEDFIDGREFHVTLWGNGVVKALPAAEMDFSAFADIRDRLCTFDSKFSPESIHYKKIELRLPAPLDEAQTAYLNETAIKAYQAMGCRDYARVDLRLGRGLYYVLDVNPNADFSPDTSLAFAAEAAGLSYGKFASRLINLAAQRHPIFSEQF